MARVLFPQSMSTVPPCGGYCLDQELHAVKGFPAAQCKAVPIRGELLLLLGVPKLYLTNPI